MSRNKKKESDDVMGCLALVFMGIVALPFLGIYMMKKGNEDEQAMGLLIAVVGFVIWLVLAIINA